MAILTKAQILGADDLHREVVPAPEWEQDGAVLVQTMTGAARGAFEAAVYEQRGGNTVLNFRIYLIYLCANSIVDDDGTLLFTTAADIAALAQKSSVVLLRVAEVAQRLSGITQADQEALKKTSATTHNGAPSSAWPGPTAAASETTLPVAIPGS